ncbi:MAG: nucleotidyltransferase domain-containing protein [Bradymonadaceae bacterium]
MNADLETQLASLADAFEELEDVRALWVFGSAARGETGPLSDVDLAVWLDDSPTLDRRLELQRRAVERLGREDVDLVPIGEASPVLQYRVVTDGRRLYAREPPRTDRFEQRCVMRYLDTAHLRERVQRLQREAVE